MDIFVVWRAFSLCEEHFRCVKRSCDEHFRCVKRSCDDHFRCVKRSCDALYLGEFVLLWELNLASLKLLRKLEN